MKVMGKDRSAAVRFDDIVGRFNVILSSKYFIVVNEFPQNMSISQAEAFRSVTADEDISVEEKMYNHLMLNVFQDSFAIVITTLIYNPIADQTIYNLLQNILVVMIFLIIYDNLLKMMMLWQLYTIIIEVLIFKKGLI
jgi:hypothetical protein